MNPLFVLIYELFSGFLSFVHSVDEDRWNLEPFFDLIAHSNLEHLRLVSAYHLDEAQRIALQQMPKKRFKLKKLELCFCAFSDQLLINLFQLPIALEELAVIVRDGECTHGQELFEPAICEPLFQSLRKIIYISFLPPRSLTEQMRFVRFQCLQHLTITSGDLFGVASEATIPGQLQTMTMRLPASLKTLELLAFKYELEEDTDDQKVGLLSLLREILERKQQLLPALKKIVIVALARGVKPSKRLGDALNQAATEVGVDYELVLNIMKRHEWKAFMQMND